MAEILKPYVRADGVTELKDHEQTRMIHRLEELQPESNFNFTHDDIGTATLMQEIYQDEIRYCPQNHCWYIWDKRWKIQSDEGIVSDKLQTLLNVLKIYADDKADLAESKEDIKFYETYQKYVSSLRKAGAMRGILDVFKTMVRIQLYDMDNYPYIINTTLGAFDLRTEEKVENRQELNLTKCTNTYPAHFLTKRCTRWYEFVDEIMSHDKEKVAFLQRALGYSILGDNREECMFMAYGPTARNGKGTLFTAIKVALSEDYADTASSNLICEDRRGQSQDYNAPQPALAKIKSTRIVEMSEADKDIRLASAAVKSLTGRDRLVTRALYENSFTFMPQFTLWLSTNHLPAVTDDTVFMSNRIWVIEFNESYLGHEDKDLKELFTLPENQPTVLKWLMDGAKEYLANGLNPPQCVKDATLRYREQCDRVLCFIKECCEHEDGARTPRAEFYSAYKQWCKDDERGYNPLGTGKFYRELIRHGYPIYVRDGTRMVKDLKLKDMEIGL